MKNIEVDDVVEVPLIIPPKEIPLDLFAKVLEVYDDSCLVVHEYSGNKFIVKFDKIICKKIRTQSQKQEVTKQVGSKPVIEGVTPFFENNTQSVRTGTLKHKKQEESCDSIEPTKKLF